jgi:N-acetylmuramoyl-L-alanine amidase
MMFSKIVLLFSLSFFVSQPGWSLHVVIDPGHGGVDQGTTRNEIKEAETSLDVAKRLVTKLKRNPAFRVTLTRAEDRQLSLAERVRIAEQAGGDLYLSIHLNSSPDTKAKGAEFYFQNQLATDEEAMFLAHRENAAPAPGNERGTYPVLKDTKPAVRAILEDLLDTDRINQSSRLAKFLKSNWLGHRKTSSIHQAPFFVVSEVHMPATLVELGFVTNSEDYKALTDDEYLNRAAQSLYDGLKEYKDSLDKGFPAALKSPQVSSR